MKHGSLFTGIGGFDLAAEWMGWDNVFHCEKEKFCQRVLSYYWPKAKLHEDIKNTDFTIYWDRIDILTGGFPCQPYSTAGKRLGKEDDRHLWPEMLRAIREISPRWIVGENVRGLISWNGGLVFEEVQADLEAAGYEVLPFLLPAAGVGAPHRRDRIWFVAKNADSNGRRGKFRKEEPKVRRFGDACTGNNERIQTNDGEAGNAADPDQPRFQAEGPKQQTTGIEQRGKLDAASSNPDHKGSQGRKVIGSTGSFRKERNKQSAGRICPDWENFPTQPPVRGRNDGLPAELDGITFSKWRNESLKGYGNAVVPQVAYQILKSIERYERLE